MQPPRVNYTVQYASRHVDARARRKGGTDFRGVRLLLKSFGWGRQHAMIMKRIG